LWASAGFTVDGAMTDPAGTVPAPLVDRTHVGVTPVVNVPSSPRLVPPALVM